MEIRAKISLAVSQFKANAAVVGGLYKGMTADAQKHTAAVDKLINKNLSNRINAANAGRIHDMSKLSEFEKAAVRSNRKMADSAMRSGMNGAYEQMDKVRLANIRKVEAQVRAEQDKTSLMRRDRLNAEAQAAVRAVKRDEALLAGIEKKARARHIAEYDRIYQIGRAKRFASQAASKVTDPFTSSSINAARDARLASNELLKARMNTEEFNQSLARTRYALYDVGSKLLGFGTAIAVGFGQAIQKAAEFESAFTRVERTSGLVGGELAALRKSLIDLSTTMPVSFEQITAVATLGAQMGIAADSIDSFTKTVTQFSAITGVSVEQVATSLGRLGQLLDVPASKFENLSSAIAFVGVNAVATDREILVMSESISAAANQAGFAADEVVGLSGALASLKVRPEEARGVIVRLFREIDSSVSEGGTRLNDFANQLNLTSDETAKLWKSDPSEFFTSFLTAAKAGGNLNEVITALGITNSRELNVIQRLANNTDVLASTMANAREQFLLGTYSSDAYGKVQDDLASKMTMFQSALEAMQASFGDAFMGPMKVFFDMLIAIGKGLAAIPAPVKVLIGVIAALISGFLIFKGAMLIAVGGLMAMKLAMKSLKVEAVGSMGSMATFNAVLGTTGTMTAKTAVAIRILTFGMVNQKNAALMAAGATRVLGSALVFVQRAFLPLLIVGTIASMIASMGSDSNSATESVNKLGDAMIEAGGGSEELMKAIALDTQAMKDNEGYLGKMTVAFTESSIAAEKLRRETLASAEMAYESSEALRNAELGQGKMTDAKNVDAAATEAYNKGLKETNSILKEQEFALGANTAAFFNNALTKYGENSDKNLYTQLSQSLREDPQAMRDMEAFGISAAGMIAEAMKSEGGATEYITNFSNQLKELDADMLSYAKVTGYDFRKSVDRVGERFGWTAEQIELMRNAVGKSGNAIKQVPSYFFDAAKSLDAARVSAEELEASKGIQQNVLMDLGYSAEEAGEMVGGLSEQLKKYLSSASSVPSTNEASLESFNTFATGIRETEGDLSSFTENGRTNLNNFRSFMTSALAAAEAAGTGFAGGVDRISSALSVLNNEGVDTKAAFSEFQTYIATASMAEGFSKLTTKIKEAGSIANLNGLIQGMIDAKELTGEELTYAISLKEALEGVSYASSFLAGYVRENTKEISNSKKEMKSLSDYASEVGNLFRSSIDIKFSKTNGIIGLKNAMADINKNIKEAKDNLRDLQSTIAEKQTKRQQLGVDLQLAQQFGDTAGVARIRAEMTALDNEISDAQEDIAYNTGIATGSLDLNTQAGRDNLQTIQGLTTAGAEYIQGLIDSGAPQSTVLTAIENTKTAFENQLTAMGLSTTEIGKYSTAFDGFVKIVKKAPKNVTITAKTDPAERALNDFITKANASKATVTVSVKTPSKEDNLKALKAERARLAKLATVYRNKGVLSTADQGALAILEGQVASFDSLIANNGYRYGGLIQGFGGNTQDNIPIMASRDEFMMSAGSVNRYGVDFMNAVNEQRLPISGFGGGFGGGNSSTQVVYLSARDRELLQAAANRPITLKTNNRIIAQSANAGNKELAKNGAN